MFDEYFAPARNARIALAPASTPSVSDLGEFDFVSGGAVTHGVLFALARIPKVSGKVRVIEDDTNAISNANRYSLLTLDRLNMLKADDLATQALSGMDISPLPFRFEDANMGKLGQLAGAVLVGVDDIPARWAVQDAARGWLGIGAYLALRDDDNYSSAAPSLRSLCASARRPGTSRDPNSEFRIVLGGPVSCGKIRPLLVYRPRSTGGARNLVQSSPPGGTASPRAGPASRRMRVSPT